MIRTACVMGLIGLATLVAGAIDPGGPSAMITTFVGMPAFALSVGIYLVIERRALRRALGELLIGEDPSGGSARDSHSHHSHSKED